MVTKLSRLLWIVFPLLLKLRFTFAGHSPGVCPFSGDHNSHGHEPTRKTDPARDQILSWSGANSTSPRLPSRATTPEGIPVPSLTASQTVGPRGQILLQDGFLLNKLASFNRERIPERPAHAKGAGAHGHFLLTHDISRFTKAKFLNGVGKKTPIFVRFSTAGGESGSAETTPDMHGFAIKFYTEEGNHDMVGLDMEIFPIRDPILFPDLVHSGKRNPQTHLHDPNMFWDFRSLRPESTLHTLHLFSDIGRAEGFRRMNGSSVHAFKLVAENGRVVFAKFRWISNQPSRPLSYQEASKLAGTNPDYFTQDLYDSIAKTNYPKWTLYVQVMTFQQSKNWGYNLFDTTKQWREEHFPLIPVGTIVLERNPQNYFAEVEQSGFDPGNMVPGIEPSPDRMLAGRIFGYGDSLRYRLGANHAQLPINSPIPQVNSYNRDGSACFGENGGGSPNYFPNSFGGAFVDGSVKEQTFSVEGVVGRYDVQEDEFSGARLFLQKDISPEGRRRLVESIAVNLKEASEQVREKVYKNNFEPISKAFGDEVKAAVERQLANPGGSRPPPPPPPQYEDNINDGWSQQTGGWSWSWTPPAGAWNQNQNNDEPFPSGGWRQKNTLKN